MSVRILRHARRAASVALLLVFGAPRTAHSQLAANADGRTIFQSACAACHAPTGKGQPVEQVGFDYPLPDFTDCSYASREAGQDWFTIVHEGGPRRGFTHRMPSFGDALTDEQIERVVAYVRSFCKDKSWPRGELNLPRAIHTEKAFPEDESVITGGLDRTPNGTMQFDYIHEKRFGARNQLELRIPVLFRDRSSQGLGWTGGHVGDVSLAVKRAVFHTQSLTKASILSLGAEVNFPTGNASQGFGDGTVVYEPFLLAAQMLGPNAFLQFHGGLEFPHQKKGLVNEAFARLVLGRSFVPSGFGRAWTPMIEVLEVKELQKSAQHEVDIVPQMQFAFNKRQHILGGFGYAIPMTMRDSRPKRFVFYLLWDWFDGGLRDGW